jgi:DNA-binding NarL/FixJ family response regulator
VAVDGPRSSRTRSWPWWPTARTNRQIAQTLFISDKTASVHVSRILAKLGVANRVEAGAVAHRLHLTG